MAGRQFKTTRPRNDRTWSGWGRECNCRNNIPFDMFRAFFMGLLSQKQWWKLFLTRLNRLYHCHTEQHQWQCALFALLELVPLNWVAPIKPKSFLFTKPHSLRASSPVWASEACLTRTQAILGELCGGTKYELPLKRLRGRLSFPLPLAASPLARAFSQD